MAHINLQRLMNVAQSDELIFSLEEFNHLKRCSACFNGWSEFIRESVRKAPAPENKSNLDKTSD